MTNHTQICVYLEGLLLVLGSRVVLKIDELSIKQGALTLLTGPNGSGKTSLLKVLAGLLVPRRVQITCNGSPMGTAEAMVYWRGRHIYLHQQPYLFDTTVAENVGYGLKLRGYGRVQRDIQIRTALAWARLDHLADRPTHALSSGEKQRVALTRARILNPAALLADEITANMDSVSREQTKSLLHDLSRSGVTVIVASHEAGQFDDIADEHLTLDGGQLITEPIVGDVIPLKHQQRP